MARKRASLLLLLLGAALPLRAQPAVSYRIASTTPAPLGPLQLEITGGSGCQFNRVRGLLLRPDGSLIAANAGNAELCIFSGKGELRRKVGRKGGGPGEYQSIASLSALGSGTLLVYDALARRLSLLDSAGEFLRSLPVSAPPTPNPLGSPTFALGLADGSMVLGFSEFTRGTPRRDPVSFTQQLFRIDSQGKPLDALGQFLEAEHFIQEIAPRFGGVAYWDRAFGRQLAIAAAPRGFFAGDGARFSITEYALDGKPLRRHVAQVPVVALTPADIAAYKNAVTAGLKDPEQLEQARKMAAEMPFPKSIPAYRRIIAGGGRIWLERYPASGAATGVWVALETASHNARVFAMPERFRPYAADAARICGVARDQDDVESIRCYAAPSPSGDRR